jgi:hypothetical protein
LVVMVTRGSIFLNSIVMAIECSNEPIVCARGV